MKRLLAVTAVVVGLAGCGFPHGSGGHWRHRPTTTTEGPVHVEICPPYC
jgi:hypothetical protein